MYTKNGIRASEIALVTYSYFVGKNLWSTNNPLNLENPKCDPYNIPFTVNVEKTSFNHDPTVMGP